MILASIGIYAKDILIYNNITIDDQTGSKGVSYAIDALKDDFVRKFGKSINMEHDPIELSFRISENGDFDSYKINIAPEHITFTGSDEIGLIHGIYSFSQNMLGIDPCIFFTHILPQTEKEIRVKVEKINSKPYSTKYRGFFLNDEDLLTGFGMQKVEYGFNLDFMQKVYETILRLQMNSVIPSTLLLSDEPHLRLASDMGLYIMQHHAEPVGSVPLFWPKDEPYSWSTNKDEFIKFWTKAIERQVGRHVIWTLEFRGLLDHSFWVDDPTITAQSTDQDKADIINEVIDTQYKLIKKITGDQHPIISSVIRGGQTNLFNKGLLKYPKGTIIALCDNGYGVMSKRTVEAAKKLGLPLGTYLHVSLHNTKAHIRINTVDPEDLYQSFKTAYDEDMGNLCLLNVGNFKEKIFGIEQAANYMNDWDKYKAMDGAEYYSWYVKHNYGESYQDIINCYKDFIDNQFILGEGMRKPGDEFYSAFTETVLGMLFSRTEQRDFFKRDFASNMRDTIASQSTFEEKLKCGMKFYGNVFADAARNWNLSCERAKNSTSGLYGNRLDFYNSDLFYPMVKMFHLTSMGENLSKSVIAYLDKDYHQAQLNAYQALEHAKGALDMEKAIENNHLKYFKDWYKRDECARTWEIKDFLENYLKNIEDMVQITLPYKYRNSKTPSILYKFQPWFKSQYNGELNYMDDAK